MRLAHIIGGQIIFGLGLFLVYLNSAVVVEVFKGAIQPVIILLGLLAFAAAVFGKKEFRKINAAIAGVLIVLGIFGLYDEYYAVVDFLHGFIPLFLFATGIVAVISGIKQLK
jgi:hypothetical protein